MSSTTTVFSHGQNLHIESRRHADRGQRKVIYRDTAGLASRKDVLFDETRPVRVNPSRGREPSSDGRYSRSFSIVPS